MHVGVSGGKANIVILMATNVFLIINLEANDEKVRHCRLDAALEPTGGRYGPILQLCYQGVEPKFISVQFGFGLTHNGLVSVQLRRVEINGSNQFELLRRDIIFFHYPGTSICLYVCTNNAPLILVLMNSTTKTQGGRKTIWLLVVENKK